MELSQCLDDLNLNTYEKEIILFLVSVDSADANSIYKHVKVPKGRIYSVLSSLREKGFVNVIPTTPKSYRIEDVKESIRNQLKKDKELLSARIKKIETIELKPKSFFLTKNTPSVHALTGRDEHLAAIVSLRNSAKKELIQIAPIFSGTFTSNRALHQALNRMITIRIIIKKITRENKKNIKECLQLGAEIRALDSPDLIHFLVKDSDEFILGLDDYRKQDERLNFVCRNKGLLLVLEQYFANVWKKARKIRQSDLY